MLRKFDHVLDILNRFEMWAGSFFLLAIILINTANLLARWFLRSPFNWSLEISLILFVYSTMLLVPVLHYQKEFIQMNLINAYIGTRANKLIAVLGELLTLSFFAYLLPIAFQLSIGQINMLSRGLGYPRIYLSIIVPITACLCIPVSISKIIHILKEDT